MISPFAFFRLPVTFLTIYSGTHPSPGTSIALGTIFASPNSLESNHAHFPLSSSSFPSLLAMPSLSSAPFTPRIACVWSRSAVSSHSAVSGVESPAKIQSGALETHFSTFLKFLLRRRHTDNWNCDQCINKSPSCCTNTGGIRLVYAKA